MGQTVVVGYDGREPAADALRLGTLLSAALELDLVAVHVPPGPVAPADMEQLERDVAAASEGARVDVVSGESPARVLHERAEALDAHVVVLGSTHRGALGRVVPGSTVTRLVHGSPCAVAVAPRGYADSAPPDLRVIEIAFDGSPEAWQAVKEGGRLAAAAGATVRMFAVVGPPSQGALAASSGLPGVPPVAMTDYLGEEIERARESLPDGLRPDARVLHGDVAKSLLDEAEKGVDLLVMGSRGYGPVRYALAGGVGAAIVRDCPCAVMLVPRGAAD